MNRKEQRIAIAKACGWHCSTRMVELLPDYLWDANAIRAAVISLGDPVLYDQYEANLKEVMGGVGWITHATAAQMAEAYLKTLGLWK